MVLASMVLALLTQAVQAINPITDIVWLVVGGASAFLLSYLFIFGLILLNRRFPLVRKVEPGRKQDTVPRLGGVAIFLAFVIASLLFYIRDNELEPKEIII